MFLIKRFSWRLSYPFIIFKVSSSPSLFLVMFYCFCYIYQVITKVLSMFLTDLWLKKWTKLSLQLDTWSKISSLSRYIFIFQHLININLEISIYLTILLTTLTNLLTLNIICIYTSHRQAINISLRPRRIWL